jgi:hypothetical protein
MTLAFHTRWRLAQSERLTERRAEPGMPVLVLDTRQPG